MAYVLAFQKFNFTWTGAWQDGSIYQLGDAAESGGSSYLCVQPHLASAANGPPNASFWELFVEVGQSGPEGPQGPPGPVLPVVQLGSDQTRSATSFADVTGLTYPVAAGKDYFVEFGVIFRSATTFTGIAFAVDGPASPSAVVFQGTIPTGPSTAQPVHARAYDSGPFSPSVDVANSDMYAVLTCFLRNGPNSGDLRLRFASENAGQTVTVRAGSFLRAHLLN